MARVCRACASHEIINALQKRQKKRVLCALSQTMSPLACTITELSSSDRQTARSHIFVQEEVCTVHRKERKRPSPYLRVGGELVPAAKHGRQHGVLEQRERGVRDGDELLSANAEVDDVLALGVVVRHESLLVLELGSVQRCDTEKKPWQSTALVDHCVREYTRTKRSAAKHG